jgi:acyl-coenzyme A thioesterase PaaI-like protein
VTRLPSTAPPPGALPAERHPEAPAPGTHLGSHYQRCFGCGNANPAGLHMDITAGEGVDVTAQFVVTDSHQGAPGLAHGGLLACAFDEALGALNWLMRRPSVTARLETDFRRPVPVGSTLFITARCVGVAGRKMYLQAEGRLERPDGPLAVNAAAMFVAVGIEHFIAHGRPEDIEAARADPVDRGYDRTFEVNP